MEKNEIEVKIMDKNCNILYPKLKQIGAQEIFNDTLASVFFVSEDESKFVRFRWKGSGGSVRFEIKDSDNLELTVAKIFRESGTTISHEEMRHIRLALKTLGHGDGIYSVKHRTSYQVDDCRIEFDSPINSKIPPFMEIEGPSEESIIRVAKRLDISPEEFDKRTYYDLMRDYGDIEK